MSRRTCKNPDCEESIDHRHPNARYCTDKCKIKLRYKVNKDQFAAAKLQRLYGITPCEYDALLDAQGGVCAICGEDEPNGYRLSVDHCHDTGDVRGLLCSWCNRGIGHLRDSKRLLQRSIKYLEDPPYAHLTEDSELPERS